MADDVDFGCMPNRPIWFQNPTITLLNHIPARERCTSLTIDEILERREQLDGRMVCTEGKVFMDGWDILLGDADLAEPPPQNDSLEIDTRHLWDSLPRYPGDEISIAGLIADFSFCDEDETCDRYVQIEPFDITYLTTHDPADACTHVAMSELLERPYLYDSQVICSTGVASVKYIEAGYMRHIIGTARNESELPYGAVETWLAAAPELPDTPYLGSATRIQFVGWFVADDECVHPEGEAPNTETYAYNCMREDATHLELDVLELTYLD